MHLPLEEYPVIELTLVWYTALLNNPHCISNNKQWCIPQSVINGQKHPRVQKNRNLRFLTKKKTWSRIPSVWIPLSIVSIRFMNFNLYTDNRVWPLIFMKAAACQNEIPKDFLLLTQESRLNSDFFPLFKRQRLRQMNPTVSPFLPFEFKDWTKNPSEHRVLFSPFSHWTPIEGTSYYGVFCKHLFIWKKKKKRKEKRKKGKNPNRLLAIMVIKQLVVTNTSGQQWMHDIEMNVSIVH